MRQNFGDEKSGIVKVQLCWRLSWTLVLQNVGILAQSVDEFIYKKQRNNARSESLSKVIGLHILNCLEMILHQGHQHRDVFFVNLEIFKDLLMFN